MGEFPGPAAAGDWAVFVFATMVYDANHARMHAMVESCARMGFEAVYVEPPNSRSPYHAGAGAPSLNRGGLALAPPDEPGPAPGGGRVLCVPKKLAAGPVRVGLGRRMQERIQAAWLARFFERYRARTGKRVLAIVSTARWEPLLRDVAFDCLVFDKLDPPETLKGWLSTQEYVQRESALIARSALVLAITTGLDAEVRRAHPDARTVVMPNGVDIAFFDAHKTDPAPELAGVPRPVAGFLGTVAPWVDVPLLAECAAAYPDWTVAVIGPESGDVDLSPLRALPNVRIHGAVPYARVPALMQGFDIGLMPFRPGRVSDLSSPVTLYEYLALGKPLVCTPLSDMTELADLLYMSRDDFIVNVGRAAAESDETLRARRRTAAARYGWDALMHGALERLAASASATGAAT